MEVSAGIVFRPVPCLSSKAKLSVYGVGVSDAANRFVSLPLPPPPSPRRRNYFGISTSSFSDNGHLSYYNAPNPIYGAKKEKNKEKEKGSSCVITTKKKLKLLKGLSKDLSLFSNLGFGAVHPYNGLVVGEVQGKIVSEDALIRQLQQIRAEEKELKRKKKLEKAQLKATRMRTMVESESSSSSGSNDIECREVVQMSRLREQAIVDELQAGTQEQEESTSILTISLTQDGNTSNKETRFQDRSIGNLEVECCSGSINTTENFKVECCSESSTSTSSSNVVCDGGNNFVAATSAKRIEVCMGGKCKKSGGAELLEEFERAIGIEGAVVGCKCMGKCKEGPNVRVLNSYNGGVEAEGVDDSVRTPSNPLCLGVGLADVGVILANFFGEDGGLAPAV